MVTQSRKPAPAVRPTTRTAIRRWRVLLPVLVASLLGPATTRATGRTEAPPPAPCCEPGEDQPPFVWSGTDPTLSLERLAAYCAPVLWFSPDEPLLNDATYKEIRIPEPFPFEEDSGGPVVYFRVRRVFTRGTGESVDLAYQADPIARENSLIDLRHAAGIDLDFFFYYSSEEGLNRHRHDVESIQMRVVPRHFPDCAKCPYALQIGRAVAKAHGVLWYDNTLEFDQYCRWFPLHVFQEEGKHASCPDRNADGHYTPGYDVNRRVNDAWGVRDVISSGRLFTAGYQAWMTKVRTDETRVLPPLPEDSPHREWLSKDGVYAPRNAVYELRPFPSAERAEADLVPFIADKGDPDWPEVDSVSDLKQFFGWLDEEGFVKSWGVSARYDGDLGVAAVFPFFIFRNYEDALAGGWLVHRIYFKDKRLRDFGWTPLYTLSASRWLDGYFALGLELDEEDTPGGVTRDTRFVTESGFKFRVNITHTPLRFVQKLGTDFWGLRLGMKFVGAMKFSEIGYVVEFGAGVW